MINHEIWNIHTSYWLWIIKTAILIQMNGQIQKTRETHNVVLIDFECDIILKILFSCNFDLSKWREMGWMTPITMLSP